ncbi:MAG TPA: hypothetical protein VGK70_14130 [Thermoanaerobaculia bacterium]|jgi:hypothetical protein
MKTGILQLSAIVKEVEVEEQRKPDVSGPAVGEEVRELAQAFSALGRSLFKGGRALSVELLRSVRGIVDQAREEIDRLTAEKKP